MADYQPQFEELVTAIKSFEVFPEVIKEFTELLKQRYLRKHRSPKDLEWIDELCGQYHDSCHNYVDFIKRVVATQFLGKCLSVDSDSERKRIIRELKANIRAARKPGGRLDRFLGETEREEVLEKVDQVLTEMEEMQKSEAKKAKYFQKFSDWLKGKVLEQVSAVFAKIISPLWDMVYTNAMLAVASDYDHDTLKSAVVNIGKYVPEMENSMELNRRALDGINSVLEVLETEDEETLKTSMRRLYPMENKVKNGCVDLMKLLAKLNGP